MVRNIRTNSLRLQDVFDGVVSAVGGSTGPNDAMDSALFQALWRRMAVQSQGLAGDASYLSQVLDAQGEAVRRTDLLVIVAMAAVFGAYFVTKPILLPTIWRCSGAP